MFKKMDVDNDGIVSIEELKAGLRNFGSQLAESEVQMLIEAVSNAFASNFWFYKQQFYLDISKMHFIF